MKKLYHLFFLLGIYAQVVGQTFTVETVPNPKDNGSGYISDPSNVFTATEKSDLNRTIAFVEDSTTIEIAIAIIPSIGSYNTKEFTYELFNKWGVGKADKNNGLLILTVLDQRRTEFEPGYGLEAVLPDIYCYRIGQKLVPHFKNEEYAKGFSIALDAISEIVLKQENVEYVKSDSKAANSIVNKRNRSKQTPIGLVLLYIYLISNLLFHSIYFFILYRIKKSKQEYYDRYKSTLKIKWYVPLFFFPIPYFFVFSWIKKQLKHLRVAPRFSKNGGKPLKLLNENEEDPYLAEGQISEEEIGSVDYDVWVSDDDSEILILRYDRLYSKYEKCPSCSYKTYYLSYSDTIRKATSYNSGLKENRFDCKNCNYQYTKEVVLSRLRNSDDKVKKQKSSRSKSFKSRSSGNASFGSSSFGGGSSGGGGAGVNW